LRGSEKWQQASKSALIKMCAWPFQGRDRGFECRNCRRSNLRGVDARTIACDPVLRAILAWAAAPELHPRRWTKVHWRPRASARHLL